MTERKLPTAYPAFYFLFLRMARVGQAAVLHTYDATDLDVPTQARNHLRIFRQLLRRLRKGELRRSHPKETQAAQDLTFFVHDLGSTVYLDGIRCLMLTPRPRKLGDPWTEVLAGMEELGIGADGKPLPPAHSPDGVKPPDVKSEQK